MEAYTNVVRNSVQNTWLQVTNYEEV